MAAPSPSRPLFTSCKELGSQRKRHATELMHSPRRGQAAPETHKKHYSLRHFQWEKADHLTPICPTSDGAAPAAQSQSSARNSQVQFTKQKMLHRTAVLPDTAASPAPSPAADSPQLSLKRFDRLKCKHATAINASPRRSDRPDAAPAAAPADACTATSNRALQQAKKKHDASIGAGPASASPAPTPPTRQGYNSYSGLKSEKRRHLVEFQSPLRGSAVPAREDAHRSHRCYTRDLKRHCVAGSPPRSVAAESAATPEVAASPAPSGGKMVSHRQLHHQKATHSYHLGPIGGASDYTKLKDSRAELSKAVKGHGTPIQASTENRTRKVTHENGRPLDAAQSSYATAADLHVATTTA